MTWVKICGIARVEDALAAAAAGADAVGFVFYPPSPRAVSPERAAAIAAALPRGIAKVGVFVNEGAARMAEICVRAGLDYVQLHGDEPPEVARALPCPAIRAFGAAPRGAAARIARYPAAAVLVDGARAGFYGGTGTPASRDAIAAARRAPRWILSGGLAPENVAAKIAALAPWGVDVSSGVEASAGVKDANRIAAFVAAVRASGPGPGKAAGRSGASSLGAGRPAA
ncbi:MAG: phosphoribosylanthranilate isomerase [Candidatus Odyssella sp.]|nr:phosphoribosylanthranilate isomerase [Candidatus Odyssella sp.]